MYLLITSHLLALSSDILILNFRLQVAVAQLAGADLLQPSQDQPGRPSESGQEISRSQQVRDIT